jgi:hypothetical protein
VVGQLGSRPSSACFERRRPRSGRACVTTPTVSAPRSRATCAITAAAPVPVPPPMPAVTNTMSAPWRCSWMSWMSSIAAFLPISGLAPAPRPLVSARPSWILWSAGFDASAWMSVLATTNSTSDTCDSIIVRMALPPAPPTPDHLDARRCEVVVIQIKRESHDFLPRAVACPFRAAVLIPIAPAGSPPDGARCLPAADPSEHLAQPVPELRAHAGRALLPRAAGAALAFSCAAWYARRLRGALDLRGPRRAVLQEPHRRGVAGLRTISTIPPTPVGAPRRMGIPSTCSASSGVPSSSERAARRARPPRGARR